MKKEFLFIILLLIPFSEVSSKISFSEASSNDTTYFILSSGGLGYPYHTTAIELSKLINPQLKHSKILPTISKGSIDNLKSLESGFADFVICQRDVLTESYFSNEKPLKNLTVIFPLFTEGLQIFVKGNGKVISFLEFIKRIKNHDYAFGIGNANSSTNITTRSVFKLLGIPQENFFNETILTENYSSSFNSGELLAFSRLSSYPIQEVSDNVKDFDIVSFNPTELKILEERFLNLDVLTLNVGKYPQLNAGDSISTIGTWALLVSLSKTVEKLYSLEDISIPELIARNISSIKDEKSILRLSFCNSDHFQILDDNNNIVMENNSIDNSHFFRGLPLSYNLSRLLGVKNIYNYTNFFILGLLIIIVLIIIRILLKSDLILLWHRYKHFFYATLFYLITYTITSRVIYNSEYNFFTQYAIKSSILNLTYLEFNKWLILAVLTDYYSAGIFPISTIGQIGVTITFYLIWITGLFLLIFEVVTRLRQQKRLKGMKNINVTNHFVVCGWNNTAADFIIKSKHILKNYITHNSNMIVILNDVLKDEFDKNEDLLRLHKKNQIEYIYGDAKDNRSLKAACIHEAKTIILLADNNSIEADERTLLRALAITRFCKEESKSVIDDIYIIAEINNPIFKESLYDSDVNEIVCTAETGKNILIQSMINHGISDVLDTLLTYNRNNEFYSIDLREHKKYVGMKFDELLIELRKKNILLIGIKSRHFDENGKEIIDRDLLKKIDFKEFHITRNIIVNPHTKEENDYTTDGDDELIVLAVNEKAIDDLL